MMTNTDIANIVKPFEWKFIKDETGKIDYAVGFCKGSKIVVYPNHWFFGYSTFGNCESIEDGIEKATKAYQEGLLSFIDLTKLQHPEPFWKPIEQFIPKSNFIECDLWLEATVAKKRKQFRSPCCHYVYGEWHTYLGNPLSNAVRIIAFAEIPPCEVKP